MADSGLYILWLRLDEPVSARIGALGTLSFQPGLYAYVGSAQRNRAARVQRHLRREKPLRWHIDYLRPHGEVVHVTRRDGARADECRLVEDVIQTAGARRSHLGFGASDCRCGGHLLWIPAANPPEF